MAEEDVVDLGAFLAGVFGVGVEGVAGPAGTRKRDGIDAVGSSRTGRVFSVSDSVSVDNDENACTKLGGALSPVPRGACGRRSGFRELLGSSLSQPQSVRHVSGKHGPYVQDKETIVRCR